MQPLQQYYPNLMLIIMNLGVTHNCGHFQWLFYIFNLPVFETNFFIYFYYYIKSIYLYFTIWIRVSVTLVNTSQYLNSTKFSPLDFSPFSLDLILSKSLYSVLMGETNKATLHFVRHMLHPCGIRSFHCKSSRTFKVGPSQQLSPLWLTGFVD